MLEAVMHALRHPVYRECYQHNKARLGKQRGARVAQVDIARRLAEAIWHMLTRNQSFAPAGARKRLAARQPVGKCAAGASPDATRSSTFDEASISEG